ncbi:MAG: hypothetical protein ACT6FF_09265 [Methanosarcinaceae archaeon]
MPRFQASAFRLPRRRQIAATRRTNLQLDNRLIHLGEKIEILIHCNQLPKPPDRLTIHSHFLKHVDKSQTDIGLRWSKIDDGWEAAATFKPTGVGNYLLRFSSGTRDLINPYARYFSVIDDQSTVCTFNHRLDSPLANYDNIYHRYFIPADYEFVFNKVNGKIEANPAWTGHQVYRFYEAKYGDQIYPFVDLNHLNFLPASPQKRPFRSARLSAAQLESLLLEIQNAWENDFKYQRPECMGFFTLNQQLIRAAQACHIQALSGFIPDQEIQLEKNIMNQKGMPLFPFFMDEADPRVSAVNQSAVVGFSTTAHPLLSRDFAAYHLSPAEAYLAGYASWENMQPLYNFIKQSIQNRDSRTPHFMAIEMGAHVIPEVRKMNYRLFRHILHYARRERVVFAQKLEIAKYFKRHFNKTPERAFYIADTYRNAKTSGYISPMVRQKPPRAHDILYLENQECRVCFRKPEIKPYYGYFYAQVKKNSPEKEAPVIDLSSIKLAIEQKYKPTVRFNIHISSDKKFLNFPLAFWNLPFTLEESKEMLQHNFNRFIPVIEQINNIFHAIAIVDLERGSNHFYLDLGAHK